MPFRSIVFEFWQSLLTTVRAEGCVVLRAHSSVAINILVIFAFFITHSLLQSFSIRLITISSLGHNQTY